MAKKFNEPGASMAPQARNRSKAIHDQLLKERSLADLHRVQALSRETLAKTPDVKPSSVSNSGTSTGISP